MEDMVDISMENAHWKNSLRMLLTKDQLMQRLDMALGMDMGLVLMGMVMGMVGMVTAIDMDMVMDMEDISMENDHWKNSLRMTSTKDQLMQMLDMALDMDMGLVLMDMVMDMEDMDMVMGMDMDMDMAMGMDIMALAIMVAITRFMLMISCVMWIEKFFVIYSLFITFEILPF